MIKAPKLYLKMLSRTKYSAIESQSIIEKLKSQELMMTAQAITDKSTSLLEDEFLKTNFMIFKNIQNQVKLETRPYFQTL